MSSYSPEATPDSPSVPRDENNASPLRARWRATRHLPVVLVATGVTLLMVVALFLPWATSPQGNLFLSDYGAPQPAIVAWGLLALGLSAAIVAMAAMVAGNTRAFRAGAAGGFLYLTGALIWYGSSILPSVVASGCQTNGGTLCSSSSSSPTLQSQPSAGFILGIVASLLVFTICLIGPRLAPTHPERRLSE